MSNRIAILAAATVIAIGAAPAFASTAHSGTAMAPVKLSSGMVSQATIDAGPQLPSWEDNSADGWAQAELLYLQKVCPTVLAHAGAERPNLVEFCHEPHG